MLLTPSLEELAVSSAGKQSFKYLQHFIFILLPPPAYLSHKQYQALCYTTTSKQMHELLYEGIIYLKVYLYRGKMHSDSTASPICRKLLLKSNI